MLEFTEEEIRDMFKLLSGVLQLGNIEFMTAGGAQITTKQGGCNNHWKKWMDSRDPRKDIYIYSMCCRLQCAAVYMLMYGE